MSQLILQVKKELRATSDDIQARVMSGALTPMQYTELTAMHKTYAAVLEKINELENKGYDH